MLEVGPLRRAVELGAGRSRSTRRVTVYCADIWNPAEHPYHPPHHHRRSDADPTRPDFGVADDVMHCVGTLENFSAIRRTPRNIRPPWRASPKDFRDWTEPLDLVFLDGVHHNPIFWDDLNFWFWRLKPRRRRLRRRLRPHPPRRGLGRPEFAKNHNLTYLMEGRIWVMARPPTRTSSRRCSDARDVEEI